MKTVMTFGSFDLVHPGHKYYLSEAKKLGNKLVTVVARDKTIEKVKGKPPLYPEKKRLSDIKQLGISDIVELGHETDVLNGIKKHKPNLVAIGYDQTNFVFQLNNYIDKNKLDIEIIVIGPYKENIYKSSKLKNL